MADESQKQPAATTSSSNGDGGTSEAPPAATASSSSSDPPLFNSTFRSLLSNSTKDDELWGEFWPTFKPRNNLRLQKIAALMKPGTVIRETFLPEPFVANALRIFKQLASAGVGAIVAGHKMGGKSQTLEFLAQFWKFHAKKQGSKFYGLKLSFKAEGKDQPPQTTLRLLEMLRSGIFDAGLVDACKSIVVAGEASDNNDNDDDAFLASHQPPGYANINWLENTSLPLLAYRTLACYRQCRAAAAAAAVAAAGEEKTVPEELLLQCISCIHELFAHQDAQTHLRGPCVFIFDEVGELLNKDSSLDPVTRQVCSLLLPTIKRISEQSANEHPHLLVIYSGSTSLARHIRKEHLENHVCVLPTFSETHCHQMWEAWKGTLKNSAAELDEAEKWMSDITSTNPNENNTHLEMGPGLLDYSDGVAGCLVELFSAAVGTELSPRATLAAMVNDHYNSLEASLTERKGGLGAEHIRNLMAAKDWTDFAEYGLAPADSVGPSAPVLRLIFAKLRIDEGSDGGTKYMGMLRILAGLNLSGSFNGAVAQEILLWNFVTGAKLWYSTVNPGKGKAKKHRETWRMGKRKDFNEEPCGLVQYTKEKTFADTRFVKGEAARDVFLEGRPGQLIFVPESQTFPSIDMSLAFFFDGEEEKGSIEVFHISVSIDKRHFATATSKCGHLPLEMDKKPPLYFRSPRAANEVEQYRESLLARDDFKDMEVSHFYAVWDDNAEDLMKPTAPFAEPYYVLSTRTLVAASSKRSSKRKRES